MSDCINQDEVLRRILAQFGNAEKKSGDHAFERERIVGQPMPVRCPVCYSSSDLLTVRQAAALLQVKAESIRRWLALGEVQGLRTPGGHYRVYKQSLFLQASFWSENLIPE